MFATQLPLLGRLAIFLAAGIGAGIANGVAGGGTFITFPTLIATGISPLQANLSTTVGVVPSYLGGIAGFRGEIRNHRTLLISLLPSCVVGAACGCTLLLLGSPLTFRLVGALVDRRGYRVVRLISFHHPQTRARPTKVTVRDDGHCSSAFSSSRSSGAISVPAWAYCSWR